MKKKYAFTIQEVLISLTLIGFFATVLAVSLTSLNMDKKKIVLASQQFHLQVNSLYTKFSTQAESQYDIKKGTASDLLDRIANYLDMSAFSKSCSNLKVNGLGVDVCSKTTLGIEIGIKIDNSCKTTLNNVYEYLKPEDIEQDTNNIPTSTVTNACGYIIYATKKSKHIYKQDMFIIPLKRMNVQKHGIGRTT